MPGPSSGAHQVLVYSGPGVSPLSLSYTLLTLSLLLLPHYTVQPVTPQTLATQPWESSCALLVFPGGRDLPYVEELSMKTKVTRRIGEYVREGGRYLGLCAGAYFAAADISFDRGGPMEVTGTRELAFFPGSCTGPTFPGFQYESESGSRAVSLSLSSGSTTKIDHLYYNGGGTFNIPSPVPSNVQAVARYATSEEQVAAVLTQNGKGHALLCSVHFEYPLLEAPAREAIRRLHPDVSDVEIANSESKRIAWAGQLLILLGLKPPGLLKDDSEVTEEGIEDPRLLLHPTHPSPIFILAHPSLPRLGESSFASPPLKEKLVKGPGDSTTLRDGNDELRLVKLPEDVPTFLAGRRRNRPEFPSADLDIQSLSIDKPPQPQMPDFHSIPKTVLLPTSSYEPDWTPLFNFDTYWSELDSARRRIGRKSGVMRKDHDGKDRACLGDLVWYGETVTSTQTMLDRNPLLLSHLPAPLVFLASFQLSGRGRGSNIWLSPAGCLQFSLLLTLPTSLAPKMVFIQYLMALAVCEAVDEDGKLGVRIKWPNDIYAEAQGIGGAEEGKKGRAKLGGILVNTNFIGGQWRIVVGCGINVLNALPTTSLSQLHTLHTNRSSSTTSPPPPTMESTFAKIMNSFVVMWEKFISEKGFKGFMDEYHGRWLHTNQEVTLTTTTPHSLLKIVGITPDYGLLRCVPRATTSSGLTALYDRDVGGENDRSTTAAKQTYVDLQPDGNSFDMMSGLIKTKT
ncbi:biotin---protein ligase, partial [Tremellales sp. Uapishka_1]